MFRLCVSSSDYGYDDFNHSHNPWEPRKNDETSSTKIHSSIAECGGKGQAPCASDGDTPRRVAVPDEDEHALDEEDEADFAKKRFNLGVKAVHRTLTKQEGGFKLQVQLHHRGLSEKAVATFREVVEKAPAENSLAPLEALGNLVAGFKTAARESPVGIMYTLEPLAAQAGGEIRLEPKQKISKEELAIVQEQAQVGVVCVCTRGAFPCVYGQADHSRQSRRARRESLRTRRGRRSSPESLVTFLLCVRSSLNLVGVFRACSCTIASSANQPRRARDRAGASPGRRGCLAICTGGRQSVWQYTRGGPLPRTAERTRQISFQTVETRRFESFTHP